MKHFKKLIKQYASDFYVHIIKKKPGTNNFKWNQTIIDNYLKNKKRNKSFSSNLIQDLNKLDSNDQTALMWIVDHYKSSINRSMLFELLDCAEIDVNRQNNNGDTVLNKVCRHNTTFIQALLNQKDIDSTNKNKNGEYPLKIACKYNQHSILELVGHQNDNFNILNQDGDVALILAFKTNLFDSHVINKIAKHSQINVSSWYDNGCMTLQWDYNNSTEDKYKACSQAITQFMGRKNKEPKSKDIQISFYNDVNNNFTEIDRMFVKTDPDQCKALQNVFDYKQLKQKTATQDINNSYNNSAENQEKLRHKKPKTPL